MTLDEWEWVVLAAVGGPQLISEGPLPWPLICRLQTLFKRVEKHASEGRQRLPEDGDSYARVLIFRVFECLCSEPPTLPHILVFPQRSGRLEKVLKLEQLS